MMIIYRFGNENYWGWRTQFRNSAQYNFGWYAVSAVNGMLWGTWVTRKKYLQNSNDKYFITWVRSI